MLKKQEPELIKALGVVIAERRRFIAMTQQKLADAVGVHRTYLSDIEQGRRNFSITTLYQIASCLEMTPAQLLKQADVQLRASKSDSDERKEG